MTGCFRMDAISARSTVIARVLQHHGLSWTHALRNAIQGKARRAPLRVEPAARLSYV